jgi:phosphoribosylformylglycinamidine synthase I
MAKKSVFGDVRVGLLQYPGSNCDADCLDVFARYLDISLIPIWHTEHTLPKLDALILPGGFSYGDYLRAGALAGNAKITPSVCDFAKAGGSVIGICNGFQILTEMGLLPGTLLKNDSGRFVCRQVHLKAAEGHSLYSKTLSSEAYLTMPVAHGEGRYFIDEAGLKRLQGEGQVAFRYCDEQSEPCESANPNGSIDNIAGIVSPNGRVLGMMPHPERAVDTLIGGSQDGLSILKTFLESVQ